MLSAKRIDPGRWWREAVASGGTAGAAMVAACAVALAGLAAFLIAAEKPWSDAIAKRLAADKPLRLDDFVALGTWWGALAAAVLLAAALAVRRWWAPSADPVLPGGPPAGSRRTVLLLALLAVAVAAPARVMRLNHSLWNDEEMHLRNYVWGEYVPQEDGSLRFEPVTWKRALFYDRKGNNHVGSTIECRLAHALSGGDWGPQSTFREPVLRAPAFVSGLLTIALVVVLGALMGSARAGLAAGIAMAFSPWHVRWSVEMRGYSTMLLGICGALVCLLRALQTGRWRWWSGFAACQAAFLLCFPGSLYVAIAQNLTALACIAAGRAPGHVRRTAVFRLLVANVWTAVPVAILMGPLVPQILAYLDEPHGYSAMNAGWFRDLWAHIVIGLRASGDPPDTSLGIAVNDLVRSGAWRGWAIYAVVPAVCLAGLAALAVQDWRTRFVAGTLALAATLACIQNASSGTAMMTWYLLYLAPLFAFALVWPAKWIVDRPALAHSRRLLALPVAVAALYAVLALPAVRRIVGVPRQPIRETVGFMRGVSPALADAPDEVVTLSFGGGARQMLSYDPRLRIPESVDELNALTKQAVDDGRPLFLCVRGRAEIAAEEPALMAAVLANPAWQVVAHVQGMEEMLSYDVYSCGALPVIRIAPPPDPKP